MPPRLLRHAGGGDFRPRARKGAVSLTVEELESLRLCDLEGADQSAAAQSMGVSRGTLQRIVYSARRKVADALCSGKAIQIGGGNFSPAERICGGRARCSRCRFARGGCGISDTEANLETEDETMMKDGIIAVTMEDGQIFQHFGHTRWFELYEIKAARSPRTGRSTRRAAATRRLGGLLRANGVNLLICGGIGGGAKNVLAAAGIELISGVSGPVDEAVKLYLEGKLHDDPSAECHHHDHGAHECGHHDGAPQGECRGCGPRTARLQLNQYKRAEKRRALARPAAFAYLIPFRLLLRRFPSLPSAL